jgi:hydroxyethylthiazole kinase-like uncharacterized protein yjeF
MRPVLTPAEMAAADRAAIEAGTPVAVLIDRAARAVAWSARGYLGGVYGRRVLVVCGKGNNGADGRRAAAVLDGWGVRATVVDLDDPDAVARATQAMVRTDLALDAMYGAGLTRGLDGAAAEIAVLLEELAVPVLAVDIPSGVDGTTGTVATMAVRAERTVTMVALKRGLVQEPGRSLAGEIGIADIGIDPGDTTVGLVEEDDVRGWLPPRPPNAHKWSVGGVLVVGGSPGMTGAPIMVGHAAMRAGAGIAWCAVPGAEAARSASGSELISVALPATADGCLAAGAADGLLTDAKRFRALVVGPGLGTAGETRATVARVVADAELPLVLDADGLNSLGGDVAPVRSRTYPTVLTPHAAEYARLAGHPVGDDRVAAAQRLAAEANAVVLLKGPGTVVATPDGPVAIEPAGGPELATAGSGDVLSGIVGAFLARGMPAFEAAAAAAFVLGAAARACGPDLVAPDLVDELPRTLAALS